MPTKRRHPGRPPFVEGGFDFMARVRMPSALWRRIEAIAGPGKASDFAREALEKWVRRAEGMQRQQAAEEE